MEEMGAKKEDYFAGEELTFDELEIGMEFPPTTYELTEKTIAKYIEVIGDKNLLYMDEEEAEKSGFEGVIAPATILSLYTKPSNILSGLRPKKRPPSGSIHAAQKYEFIKEIRPGDTITSVSKVVDKYLKKGRKYLHIETCCYNKKEEKVAVGEATAIWGK